MNVNHGSLESINAVGRQIARRFPLTVRTVDLLLVSVLYVLGIVVVDEFTGASHWPVMVFAMFAMPLVLSVAVRLYRALARRVGTYRVAERHLAQAG